MIDLGDFSKTGFTVIPGWLTSDEVELFMNDYNKSKVTENKNYQITCASEPLLKAIKPKIEDILTAVNTQTELTVDLLTPGAMYTDTSWIDWGWHQDHESFYTLQQHKNYLNFYVILKKEDPTMSGLSVVPFTSLSDADLGKIVNQGANVFIPNGNETIVHSDETGEEFNLAVNIDVVAVSPILMAGDLLLMRGDVIHKTQDNKTQRVAVSIRCTNSSDPISKDKLLSGCEVKQAMIRNNQKTYDSILEKFENSAVVTALDLYKEI